jgi:hypothetical protein
MNNDTGKFLRAIKDGFIHWCPGCKEIHGIRRRNKRGTNRPSWAFNDDYEKPTFIPSVKITIPDGAKHGAVECCHYFIREGMIEFCSDSTHELRGQTVSMVELDTVLKDDGGA